MYPLPRMRLETSPPPIVKQARPDGWRAQLRFRIISGVADHGSGLYLIRIGPHGEPYPSAPLALNWRSPTGIKERRVCHGQVAAPGL